VDFISGFYSPLITYPSPVQECDATTDDIKYLGPANKNNSTVKRATTIRAASFYKIL